MVRGEPRCCRTNRDAVGLLNAVSLARPERFELEPVCGREAERSDGGSPQAKSRAERGIAEDLARPERFELPTYSSGGCRSIQLSYGRAGKPQSVYIGFSAAANLPELLLLVVETK